MSFSFELMQDGGLERPKPRPEGKQHTHNDAIMLPLYRKSSDAKSSKPVFTEINVYHFDQLYYRFNSSWIVLA